jgi:hypothetical protein
MTFSSLILKNKYSFVAKILQRKESWNFYYPEDISSANCQRSTSMEKMVILSGITTSWMRNPQEEWLFCWEFPAHRQGWGSARIYQLIDYKSTQGMGFRQE